MLPSASAASDTHTAGARTADERRKTLARSPIFSESSSAASRRQVYRTFLWRKPSRKGSSKPVSPREQQQQQFPFSDVNNPKVSHGDKDGILSSSAKDSDGGGDPRDSRVGLLLLQGREGGGVQLEEALLGEQGEPHAAENDENGRAAREPVTCGRNQGREKD